jgi:hypothetical protein
MTKAIQGLSLVPRIHSIVVSGVGWPWLVKEMTGQRLGLKWNLN